MHSPRLSSLDKQLFRVHLDCRRRWRRSFAIRLSSYRTDHPHFHYFMLITHVWTTQMQRFWKAKAQHASATPQLSRSSYCATIPEHRAIASALTHQASARFSCLAASHIRTCLAFVTSIYIYTLYILYVLYDLFFTVFVFFYPSYILCSMSLRLSSWPGLKDTRIQECSEALFIST